MWREYTRETPARPGWAVVSAGAALVVTTSLAWVLTNHGPSAATVGQRVSPAGWPISFSLPENAKPLLKWERRGLQSDTAGNFGALAYRWDGDDADGATRIVFRYAVLDTNFNLPGISNRSLSEDFENSEEATIGPMKGRAFAALLTSGDRFYSALASIEEGLVVRIDMIAPPEVRRSESVFRRICDSVEFRPFYSPPDPEHYLDDFLYRLLLL